MGSVVGRGVGKKGWDGGGGSCMILVEEKGWGWGVEFGGREKEQGGWVCLAAVGWIISR